MFNIKPVKLVQPEARPTATPGVNITALTDAAAAFRSKGQTNNASICDDMAAKLRRFGSFASEKQAAFAGSLVARAQALAAPKSATPTFNKTEVSLPKLFDVMQRHATFHIGELVLSRRNQDTLVWVKHARCEKVIGKIENGMVTLWHARMRDSGIEIASVENLLVEMDEDPITAAMKYGKLSGRCCSCGRDLTDPESIERGIGPVCAEKF